MAQSENPLDDTAVMNIVRQKFSEISLNYQNDTPVKITIPARFYKSDKRTISVYNFLNLIDVTNNTSDNLILSILESLLNVIDCADQAVRIAMKAGDTLYRIFSESVSSRLAGGQCIRRIAQFLGTDEKLAIQFFISSVFSSFGMISTGVIAILSTILMNVCPFVNLIIDGISIFYFYQSRKAQIEMEKGQNQILLLNMLFNRLLATDIIMDCNVLVVAEDKFDTFLSFFRSNQGVWCGIKFINNLPCAPRARDIPHAREIIQTFANIRDELSTNGNFDVNKIRRKVESYYSLPGLNHNRH